jgi:hypothetical protein
MPRIELIPEVYHAPNDPYHWEYDNLPLKNIIERQNIINLSLDNVLEEMRAAIGTQGSMSNRIAQSINDDGSLKTTAIDDALHSVEEHTDSDDYVRMTVPQSAKLDLITDEATDLVIHVDPSGDGSNLVQFNSGTVSIQSSSSVTPVIESPNILKFDLAFPVAAAHRHFYGQTPVSVNLVTPDYINYKVDSASTAYVDESLGVYINGVRIFEDDDVYVPGPLVDDPWTLMSFTSDYANGLFELSTAISEDDIIKIDFERSFV